MEESKEQQSLHRLLQFSVYISVVAEILIFEVYRFLLLDGIPGRIITHLLVSLSRIPMYKDLLYSKLFTLGLIMLVSVGTLSRKKRDFNSTHLIVFPLVVGLSITFSGIYFHSFPRSHHFLSLIPARILYVLSAFAGTILVHVAMDNISKIIATKLGRDRWNIEEESFMQPLRARKTPYSVNIPMLFYFRGRVRKGWINIDNIFRGTLLIGTPGSGKSFGVVNSFIRQLIAKEFTACIYDFKFPDLGKIAYYHFLKAKREGKCRDYAFHVINLSEVQKSRRVNPWKSEYIKTLADASETAEALVEALKKGDKSGGSDQFFTQSAVNFLASCIYFFSKYEQGRYSSLPHVLAFLNCSYEEIFHTLFSEPELSSLLSPFMTAYRARAFEQLEGQVGTLKIFISRLATKETFWVFSGDDVNLKISGSQSPSVIVLANDPETQSINSACYSVVLNRLTRLINTKGNLPSALIIDEVPTLFMHRIENLIATARSNKVGVLLGLQELPQFKQQYGKETATTIAAVIGNVLSGSVRNKETLDWLERLFGKVKQTGESLSIDRSKTSLSLSEKLEPLIPAGKIASLKAGEMVGILAAEAEEGYSGKYETSAVHCKVNLDMDSIKKEEAAYPPMPDYYQFGGKTEEVLRKNYQRITTEVKELTALFKPPAPRTENSAADNN
ncbi:type IV secretion system DNA-binding domain-containing protein [Desertivirga brevis]|uniref:type IV secretion system DNA-binding domain-containing protein n=1 Tax=Desertivirga brevis TaxID=2810310 RepID=UPI001A972A87|nr:type IV secretion system DNA-binding domain-containing protein [Pedobacter sp. SYSU D00873]